MDGWNNQVFLIKSRVGWSFAWNGPSAVICLTAFRERETGYHRLLFVALSKALNVGGPGRRLLFDWEALTSEPTYLRLAGISRVPLPGVEPRVVNIEHLHAYWGESPHGGYFPSMCPACTPEANCREEPGKCTVFCFCFELYLLTSCFLLAVRPLLTELLRKQEEAKQAEIRARCRELKTQSPLDLPRVEESIPKGQPKTIFSNPPPDRNAPSNPPPSDHNVPKKRPPKPSTEEKSKAFKEPRTKPWKEQVEQFDTLLNQRDVEEEPFVPAAEVHPVANKKKLIPSKPESPRHARRRIEESYEVPTPYPWQRSDFVMPTRPAEGRDLARAVSDVPKLMGNDLASRGGPVAMVGSGLMRRLVHHELLEELLTGSSSDEMVAHMGLCLTEV